MHIHPQSSEPLARLGELIAAAPVAMLTNVDAQGVLASRPMSPLEMDAEGAIWFFTDLRSEKVEHLRLVNLSFSDARAGTWVSLSGRGEIDTERSRIERLWTVMARPWFPDGPTSTDLALLKFVPDSADLWDAPHGRAVRLFALAASVLVGKPVGLGVHESLDDLHVPRSKVAKVAME